VHLARRAAGNDIVLDSEKLLAHEDLDQLLNSLLPFAQEMLAKHGEFFPFGGYLDVGGRIAHVNGWTGEEQPPSQQIIDLISAGLREQANRGDIRASGICVDVLTTPPGETQKRDAISVRLEHTNGESVVVLLPYRKSASGEYEYGELFAVRGTHYIFPPHGGNNRTGEPDGGR
jgi:hypothetical protein